MTTKGFYHHANGASESATITLTPKACIVNLTMQERNITIPITHIKPDFSKQYITLSLPDGSSLDIQDDQGNIAAYCLQAYRHLPSFNPRWYWFYQHQVLIFIGLFGVLMCGLFVIGLYFLNQHVYRLISLETERKMGQSMYDEYMRDNKLCDSQTLYMQRFFDDLHFKSDIPIRVVVVEKKDVNAFAMPGGFIVVYDSLLRMMTKSNQLAGLLAHEYAHIHLRHTIKSVTQDLSLSIVLNVLFGDLGALSTLAGIGVQLQGLSYSRQLEADADEHAVYHLIEQHIDPQGIFDLFDKMKKSLPSTQVPALFSTHPNFENRKQHVLQLIRKHPPRLDEHPELEYNFKKIHTFTQGLSRPS